MSAICEYHLCNLSVNKGGRFCSQSCKSKFNVDRRRKDLKILAVNYKGGCCYVCGYNAYISALDFHHLDSTSKEFSISKSGATRSWEKMKIELDKCILVCNRCHRECHSGAHKEILTKYKQELDTGKHQIQPFVTNRYEQNKLTRIKARLRECLICKIIFDPENTKRKYCSKECHPQKVSSGRYYKVPNRPSQQELADMLKTMSYCAVGRKYNVSDNAIRKWEKSYRNAGTEIPVV